MPEIKNWLYEFIQEDDVVEGEIGEFVSIPKIDEDAEFESLVGRVLYKGERRALNINKGNGKRLAEVLGMNSDLWHHKKFTIRLPKTPEEKKSKTKLIIEPFVAKGPQDPGSMTKEQRTEALRARGISEEQIKTLDEIGAL